MGDLVLTPKLDQLTGFTNKYVNANNTMLNLFFNNKLFAFFTWSEEYDGFETRKLGRIDVKIF